MSSLSVVIPLWNQRALALACVRSVLEAVGGREDVEVIVVDDASTDGAPEAIEAERPEVTLLRAESATPRGFAHAANRGMAHARGELLLLLNSDTELARADLDRLVAFLERNTAYSGAVPRLVNPDGSPQRACLAFPRWYTPLFFGTPLQRWWPRSFELRRYFLEGERDASGDRDVEQPPAAAWLLRRSAWERVGAFDERLELFFNDVDWCRRLAVSGGGLRLLESATVLHHGGASTAGRADFVPRWHTDRLRYVAKHHGRLAKAFTKLCVTWTFLDWSGRELLGRLRGRRGEPIGPLTRAFVGFLRG